jgi:hypothetical protein
MKKRMNRLMAASCVVLGGATWANANVTPGAIVDLDALNNPLAPQNKWSNNGTAGGFLLPTPANGSVTGQPVLESDLTNTYYRSGDGATWGTSPAAANNPSIQLENFTFEVWLQRTTVSTGSEHHLLGLSNAAGSQYVQLVWREGGDSDGQLNVFIKGQTTTRNKFFDIGGGPATFNNNAWYQLAVTYDDTSKALNLYQDTNLVGSVTSTQDMDPTQFMKELVLFKTNPAESNDRRFTGDISRFRLYNNVLSPSQLADNFAFGNTGIYSGPPTWNVDTAGDWNLSGNWKGGVAPVGVDSEADFMGAISTAHSIYSDTSITAGTLRFNNNNAYVIGGAGDLTLQVSTGNALVQVQAGSHKINLPMTIASNTTANIATGATLVIADPVTVNSGKTFTKTGNGTLNIISTWEGAGPSMMMLQAGNVAVSSATDLGTSTSLTATGGTATFKRSQHLGAVSISSNGHVVMNTGGSNTLYANSLNITGSGNLDLNDNDLVVNNASFSTIQGLVFDGYSTTPDTNKTGITSMHGQANGGVAILALFNNALFGVEDYPFGSGQTISANAIVGKYTYIGDTDWNGEVNSQDYTAIDANLGVTGLDPGLAWFSGDTNFDGNIDPNDYTGIDAALGLGVGNPLAAQGLAAVPEPVGLSILAFSQLLLARRRRHR